MWNQFENIKRLREILLKIIELFYKEHRNLKDLSKIDREQFKRAFREIFSNPDSILQFTKRRQFGIMEHWGIKLWFNEFKADISKINSIILKYEKQELEELRQKELKQKALEQQRIETQRRVEELYAKIRSQKIVLPRDLIIKELATNPKYSHAVWGCFPRYPGETGQKLQEYRGQYFSSMNELQVERLAYSPEDSRQLFGREGTGQVKVEKEMEFKGRILGQTIDDGSYLLKLIYLDFQEDRRGEYIYYAIVLPKEEVSKILPTIHRDPSIMITIFRKIFPHYKLDSPKDQLKLYDRSEGNLAIDDNNPGILDGKPWHEVKF